jgi:hypothetical protein
MKIITSILAAILISGNCYSSGFWIQEPNSETQYTMCIPKNVTTIQQINYNQTGIQIPNYSSSVVPTDLSELYNSFKMSNSPFPRIDPDGKYFKKKGCENLIRLAMQKHPHNQSLLYCYMFIMYNKGILMKAWAHNVQLKWNTTAASCSLENTQANIANNRIAQILNALIDKTEITQDVLLGMLAELGCKLHEILTEHMSNIKNAVEVTMSLQKIDAEQLLALFYPKEEAVALPKTKDLMLYLHGAREEQCRSAAKNIAKAANILLDIASKQYGNIVLSGVPEASYLPNVVHALQYIKASA